LFHYAYKLRISRIIGLKTMTVSSYSYKKDFHFVIIGTLKGESKFSLLEKGPSVMALNSLQERVEKIESNNEFR
jgi:hypothetical protein